MAGSTSTPTSILVVLVRPDVYVATMSERRAIAESIGGTARRVHRRTRGRAAAPDLPLRAAARPCRSQVRHAGGFEEPRRTPAPSLGARAAERSRNASSSPTSPGRNRSPQWFEDRAWVWLHYCADEASARRALRGRRYAGLLSRADPWPDAPPQGGTPAAGRPPHRTGRSRQRGSSRDGRRPSTGSAALRALERSIDLYFELRQADPPPATTPHMPEALRDFIRTAASRWNL